MWITSFNYNLLFPCLPLLGASWPTLKMETIGSSETLGTVYNITWWHNPKNYNPSSCHWKLQTLYSFTCCIDVKLGLSLRKGLRDSNFTSLLGHYKSPGWWQQDMTCVLSTQRSIWYQVGHVCLKNPTLCCALPSSCCILLLPHGGLLPCMFSSGWRQVPTPFTWILYSFPAFTQANEWCNVVTCLQVGIMLARPRGVTAAVLAPKTMVHSINHFGLQDFQVALQSSY